MWSFRKYPYTNFHELNADWIIQQLKDAITEIETATANANAAAESAAQAAQAAAEAAQSAASAVRFTPQALSGEQRAQARTNIGAVSTQDIPSLDDCVLYSEQSRTAEEQAQARNNIGAAAIDLVRDAYRQSEDRPLIYIGSVPFPRTAGNTVTLGNVESWAGNYDYSSLFLNVGSRTPNMVKGLCLDIQSMYFGVVQNDRVNNIITVTGTGERLSTSESSSDVMMVGVGPDELGESYTATASRAEIIEAFNNEKVIYCLLSPIGRQNTTYVGLLTVIGATVVGDVILPANPGAAIPTQVYHIYIGDSGGTDVVTVSSYNTALVPVPTTAENNHVLRALSGRAVWRPDKITLTSGVDVSYAAISSAWDAGIPVYVTVDYGDPALPATTQITQKSALGFSGCGNDFRININESDAITVTPFT